MQACLFIAEKIAFYWHPTARQSVILQTNNDPDNGSAKMTRTHSQPEATPVGILTDLEAIAVASVIYLRLWHNGAESQSKVWNELAVGLGSVQGRKALQAFDQLRALWEMHGRRPMIQHDVNCHCLGPDEACFANFITTAADGEHADAMLIATLLVQPNIAPLIASLATDFGLALKQMHLGAPKALG